MFEEAMDEAKDFFEDIFEHLFEHDDKKKKKGNELYNRTRGAYHFTERVDSLIKMVFGASIFVSAMIASVWGFASMSAVVESFVEGWLGRTVLLVIGVSYAINGAWRLFHSKK